MVVGIGVYSKREYQEVLSISEDKEGMDATWEEWKKSKKKAMNNFKLMGIKTIDINVTALELVKYCRERGMSINGKSRASFVSYKVSEMNK